MENDIGYDVISPEICQAIFYEVPQKRERLFLIGIKKGSGLILIIQIKCLNPIRSKMH